MPRLIATFVLVLCVLTAAAVALPAQAALTAGAARADITPDVQAMAPVVQGGYGARMGKPAEGVHDPVYARALAISDGERRVCIVGMDLTGVPDKLHSDLVERLGDELGLDYGSLLVCATHTHSSQGNMSPVPPFIAAIFGPYNEKLYDFVRDRTEQAIREAISGMQPAEIGCATRQLPEFNHNRRDDQGNTMTDDQMTVLYAKTPDGGPIGMAVFYTAHATILDDDNMLISGDWPGAMERAIEFAVPGVVALHINGAEGDQSPSAKYGGTYASVQFYGADLARHAVELAQSAEAKSDCAVASAWVDFELPQPEVSPAFMEITGKEYNISKEMAESLMSQVTLSSIPISAIRVGDFVVAAMPGEAICELGLELKRRARDAGAAYAAIGGLAGRDVSYILNEEQYNRGGYEASMSFYGPRLGELLVDGLTELINEACAGIQSTRQ
ncbi:MAG: neutral/alkaline non-lysosomal ceramidase N-terminal domain-containing protein [Armatimonadota bacterium]|nr:MAG: neutral/alkaline non-lysosomal ceramidase N-terminal domain-containing protein [Armatimonadota bacterium]